MAKTNGGEFEPLGQAALWRRQSERYEALGQRAWSDAHVPWRITTCPWVAHFEAELIAEFAGTEPVTVWDIGAGTGRLAFHLARELEQRGVNASLLITDVAHSNVEAWQRQPQLAALIERGRLRTGVFDVLNDEPEVQGPVVVLAHYLFDSLPHSAWRRRDGVVQEGWVSEGDDGTFAWSWRDSKRAAPTGEAREHLFPDGALSAINRVCRGRFMLVAIDKGANDSPTIARHETVSAGVNFEALAAATPHLGWLESKPSSVLQFAAATKAPVKRAWRQADQLLELMNQKPVTLEQIIERQAALHDDPDTLAQLSATARALLPTATLEQVQALVAAIARAADRHFILAQRLDVPFALGTLAHACGALRLAEALYVMALRESGETAATLHNLALIYEATNRNADHLIARVSELTPKASSDEGS